MKIPTKATKACRNFILRSGTIVCTTYCFESAGIWGSPEDTTKLYANCKTTLKPKINEFKKWSAIGSIKMPPMRQTIRNSYNDGIKGTFQFMQKLPDNAETVGKQTLKKLKETHQNVMEAIEANRQAAAKRTREIAIRLEAKKMMKAKTEQLVKDDLLIIKADGRPKLSDRNEAENIENKQQLLLMTSSL